MGAVRLWLFATNRCFVLNIHKWLKCFWFFFFFFFSRIFFCQFFLRLSLMYRFHLFVWIRLSATVKHFVGAAFSILLSTYRSTQQNQIHKTCAIQTKNKILNSHKDVIIVNHKNETISNDNLMHFLINIKFTASKRKMKRNINENETTVSSVRSRIT